MSEDDYIRPLLANGIMSCFGGYLCFKLIDDFVPIFIKRNLFGRDLCKSVARRNNEPIAEPMGVITATIYLVIMFLFIPIPFGFWVMGSHGPFPYHHLAEFLSGLLAVCSMILLGFADDVLDLRWRHKLVLPLIASVPLVMVYILNSNSTTVMLPKQLGALIGHEINLGYFYYIYMIMVQIFCTNSINILAGINGLESGQSLIIAISVMVYNCIQLYRLETQEWTQLLSLYFLMPYVTTTAALFYYNKYPSRVFVGDTFCYFSGVVLAVVGILGHFSKTLLLFFIPQIINFLYSVPQLFHLIPCPRHRLPRYVEEYDLLEPSTSTFKKKDLKFLGNLVLQVCKVFKLASVEEVDRDGETYITCSNFTILNLLLFWFGPMHEKSLVAFLLCIQVIGTCVGLLIRFFGASLIYDVVQ